MLPDTPNQSVTGKSLFLQLKQDAPAREVAWEEFVDRYSPIITGFARRLVVRSQDIGDLVQEVILKFFSAVPDFSYDPNKGRFRGYLKVCTWRVFQRQFGKTICFHGKSIDQIDAGELSVEASWNDIWETERLRRAVDLVRTLYSSRPERTRTFQAFEMCALFNRSADEVAGELEMSVESVHQAKSRITKAIREAMTDIDETLG